MPIYEFYCPDCHTVFNFLSRKPDTTGRPSCPGCSRPRLERRVSVFAIAHGRAEAPADDAEPPPGFDESRMERMMADLAREAEHLDENDPRQMAGLMRRLFDGSGMHPGPAMEEAVRRMEAGESPDRIEEEMGSLLEGEDETLFGEGGEGLRGLRRRLVRPRVDPTLHEM
jgi:putative FmdB family regulatory protein